MNKIKVVNNKIIPCDDSLLVIDNNSITFMENGSYEIEYIDCDKVNISIDIADGICIQLFEFSENNSMNSEIAYNLRRDSSLILSKFYYNMNTDEKVTINLNGDKASIKYNFSNISSGNEKYQINIYHNSKKTASDIYNRTIAKENSRNYFDINSFVDNGIKDCYLNQQTKIITIGESDNRINPNMFIGEDSTTAIHSSAIGSISEDDLFYLMTRAIDYRSAMNLIIKGIVLSNINPNMETKERILAILEKMGGE